MNNREFIELADMVERICHAGSVSGVAAARAVLALRKIGAAGRLLGERQCNGVPRYDATARQYVATWTEADQDANDRAHKRAKARAIAEAAKINCTIVATSRDPRGAYLTIADASGREYRL